MDGPSPWAIPSALACGLLVGLLAHVWRRARGPLRPTMLRVVGGALLFALGDLATFVSVGPTAYWTALLVLYGGILLAAPGFFLLAAREVELREGREPRPGLARLADGWAVASGLALVTNPWHGAFLAINPAGANAYQALWYLYAITGYGWMLGAIALSARLGWRGPDATARREGRHLALGGATALSGNLVYLASPWPLPFDPTSLGLCVGAIVFLDAIRLGLPGFGGLSAGELLRAATDGVILIDEEGRVAARNPAVSQWLPDAPREGEPVLPALARAFVQRERADQPLSEQGLAGDLFAEAQPPEGHLFRLRGQNRWVRVASLRMAGRDGGSPVRLLRLRDETELQRLVAATDDQASTLEAVLSATDEGVLVVLGGEIRFSNPQIHAIWGTPPELRESRSPHALLEALLPQVAERERLLGVLKQVREDPLAHVHEEIRLADGRLLAGKSLPLLRHGRAVGRVWRVRDLTEQRHAEEAFLQAQKLESLGILSAGVAHDFNNLLTPILGNAELMRTEIPEHSAAREYLEDIQRATERAGELTRQGRAYAGKGAIDGDLVHLSELVAEVVALLRASVPRTVRLRCELAPGLPLVKGDPSQIRQVVINLVLNAADAIGDREGTISVVTETREVRSGEAAEFVRCERLEPGVYVSLSVADDGSGMSPELRQRIFDPFFTTKFTGRGLGLAATLGIVHSHGGHVRVESEAGRGSVFQVLLPGQGEAVPARRAVREVPETGRLEATVLVVDDEPHVARVAARIVEAAGGRARIALGGEEALTRYRQDGAGIDVILLDLTMPDLGGLDTLRA
ncbi:MAG: ATP-binding protein, partial [Myxococcota bacterium]|nr:ATP-binding protein [Myxococcota bacterium]